MPEEASEEWLTMDGADKHYAQARGLRAEIMACLTGLGMMLTGQTPRCQSPDVNFEELLDAVQALVDVVSDL